MRGSTVVVETVVKDDGIVAVVAAAMAVTVANDGRGCEHYGSCEVVAGVGVVPAVAGVMGL